MKSRNKIFTEIYPLNVKTHFLDNIPNTTLHSSRFWKDFLPLSPFQLNWMTRDCGTQYSLDSIVFRFATNSSKICHLWYNGHTHTHTRTPHTSINIL